MDAAVAETQPPEVAQERVASLVARAHPPLAGRDDEVVRRRSASGEPGEALGTPLAQDLREQGVDGHQAGRLGLCLSFVGVGDGEAPEGLDALVEVAPLETRCLAKAHPPT